MMDEDLDFEKNSNFDVQDLQIHFQKDQYYQNLDRFLNNNYDDKNVEN